MTQPPFNNESFGQRPHHYQQQQYPPHLPTQQHRPQHVTKPKTNTTTKFSFDNLKALPWTCRTCHRFFADVFEAGSHEIVTGHEKGREMTEKEVLSEMEKEKRAELEGLKANINGGQPMGYQGKHGTPNYTSHTIPGLGSIPPSSRHAEPAPRSSNESEMNRLRRENSILKASFREMKTHVMPRMEALAEDLKSLNSKTAEHQEQILHLTSERDQLKAEVDALRAGDGHQEIDLDMDFS